MALNESLTWEIPSVCDGFKLVLPDEFFKAWFWEQTCNVLCIASTEGWRVFCLKKKTWNQNKPWIIKLIITNLKCRRPNVMIVPLTLGLGQWTWAWKHENLTITGKLPGLHQHMNYFRSHRNVSTANYCAHYCLEARMNVILLCTLKNYHQASKSLTLDGLSHNQATNPLKHGTISRCVMILISLKHKAKSLSHYYPTPF